MGAESVKLKKKKDVKKRMEESLGKGEAQLSKIDTDKKSAKRKKPILIKELSQDNIPVKRDTTNKRKEKKKRQSLEKELSLDKVPEKRDTSEVSQMSSGDEDCSKGMKKWIAQYHQSRPGIKLLKERIDNYIIAHAAHEEQARKEREAQVAEGGWTVVVNNKGRKRTTDAESGVSVGSISQATVLENLAKKKKNEVGLDFYRFQRREAKKNEILMLQSKFEQDRKRIQQMRAARKFRPY